MMSDGETGVPDLEQLSDPDKGIHHHWSLKAASL